MRDQTNERSPGPKNAVAGSPNAEPASRANGAVPHRRERHAWRLVVGLTGLLGVAWAVAIASRYPNLVPG